MHRRSYVAIGSALALVAVLSACSSSKKTGTTGSAPTGASSTTQQLTGATIKIGVISSDTNASGSNQDVPQTAQRWASYVNSHGGINGHPVQVIEKDDSASPATALQDFETLQQDGVVAIGDYSFVDTAFQKQADAAMIPVFNLGTPEYPPYGSDPNFFDPYPAQAVVAWNFGETVKVAGKTKFGYVYCAEVAACAQGVPVLTKVLESVGATMAYAGSFSATAPNYTAQCVAAKDAGVDIMIAAGPSATAGLRVIDDCAAQNFYPMDVLGGQTTPKNVLTDKNIKTAIGGTLTYPFFVRNSVTAPFHAAMDSYLTQATGTGFALMLDWAGMVDIGTVAQLGIPAGATPSTTAMYTGAYSMNGNTLGGLVGPINYQQGKGHTGNCEFYFGLANGQFTSQYGLQPQCDPAVTPS